MLFINEPFEKGNISPMQWRVTVRSDTVLSRKTPDIDLYGHIICSYEYKLNKQNRYEDDFYDIDDYYDRDPE